MSPNLLVYHDDTLGDGEAEAELPVLADALLEAVEEAALEVDTVAKTELVAVDDDEELTDADDDAELVPLAEAVAERVVLEDAEPDADAVSELDADEEPEAELGDVWPMRSSTTMTTTRSC